MSLSDGIPAIISAILVLVVSLIAYIKWKQTYWTRKGVPVVDPKFLFGNFRDVALGKISLGGQLRIIYAKLKEQGAKHGGIYSFTQPLYMPVDLDIIKAILIKDFPYFTNHGLYFNEELEPLTGGLFNVEDQKWKNLRTKLTPTFTSGRMKMMFQTFIDCTKGLNEVLNELTIRKEAVDVKDVLGRFTTDIIGSVAFGIECNSLKNPDSEFRQYGKRLFTATSFKRKLQVTLLITLPRSVLDFIKFRQNEADVDEFFMNVVKETVEHRETNNIYRKDFLHLLIQLKNMGKVTDGAELKSQNNEGQKGLTMNELAAQVFSFFGAGFETSSNNMTFVLMELARHPDIQEKLREEIEEVVSRHDGKITYDAIMEMKYLDRVINETLRKWTPFPGVPRGCTKDYKVPGTDVTIKKGTLMIVALHGLHHDPEYFPDPEKFDPDRFLEENKSKRPAFAYLPFGEGPRMCIGLRFAIMQSKVGVVATIKNFRISLNERTKLPIELTSDLTTSVKGGVWLNTSKV